MAVENIAQLAQYIHMLDLQIDHQVKLTDNLKDQFVNSQEYLSALRSSRAEVESLITQEFIGKGQDDQG